MNVDLYLLFGILTGFAIGWIILLIRRKKTNEPEQDERTEKVACKSVQSTIVVIMFLLAIICWGDILDLFKLETLMAMSLIFLVLLLSLIGFRGYYNLKEH